MDYLQRFALIHADVGQYSIDGACGIRSHFYMVMLNFHLSNHSGSNPQLHPQGLGRPTGQRLRYSCCKVSNGVFWMEQWSLGLGEPMSDDHCVDNHRPSRVAGEIRLIRYEPHQPTGGKAELVFSKGRPILTSPFHSTGGKKRTN